MVFDRRAPSNSPRIGGRRFIRQHGRRIFRRAARAFALLYSSCADKELPSLPTHVLLDVISSLPASRRLDCLLRELSSLSTFSWLYACPGGGGIWLHQCFQQLGSEKQRAAVALADAFAERTQSIEHSLIGEDKTLTAELKGSVQLGLTLGTFLTDVGCLHQAGRAYKACLTLLNGCLGGPQVEAFRLTLDCYGRLLRTLTMDRAFVTARSVLSAALQLVDMLENRGTGINAADIYTAAAELYFVKHDYRLAFNYSQKALYELDCSVSIKVIVDTLRQCAVTSVMTRDFPAAGVFAKQALILAKHAVGEDHPCYVDALLSYAFCLLNSDSVDDSVIVYEEATRKRQWIYGETSFLTASCYEELAYALYLQKDSSGGFARACELVEASMRIYSDIFSREHLVLSSTKRTKALILEEIALDREDLDTTEQLLGEALQLHTDALQLAKKTFGDNNPQTAKHYGNLGRLYQSIGDFDKAQELHLKAIAIKEQVLGEEHYEVALSVGHLAALYNYDMELYDEAETLYLRSVALGLKLFGPTYSELEYHYGALVWLYTTKNDSAKANRYQALLNEWNDMRMRKQASHPLSFLSSEDDSCPSPVVPAGIARATASPSVTNSIQQCLPQLALTIKAPHSCTLPLCSIILPRLRLTDDS